MGKYTIYGGAVDEHIEKHYLQKIIASFKADAHPIAIILFGGFGKGEGSVEIIDGKAIPFNDFDFYIVTSEKLTEEKLDEISHNASHAIEMGGEEIAYFPESGYDRKKFFHVDVRCIPYDQLPTLMKTQRYYELKYKSQIIDGDKNVQNKIPEIKPTDIPLSEGLRNLFNKIHTMLLGLSDNYPTLDQKKIKIFWSMKAYLSICEALLILNRTFAPSAWERNLLFRERYKKDFPELYEKIKDLDTKVDCATRFKLKLDFNVDAEKLWKEALGDLLIVFEYFVKKISGGKNVVDAINHSLPYSYFKPYLQQKIGFNFYPAQYALNLGYVNVLRKKDRAFFMPLLSWKDVGLRIILPIYYLLLYQLIDNNRKKDELLERAYQELSSIIMVEKKEFWHLRERALKAFGLYYQQRLL